MQFNDDVVGGVTLVRPAIQSPDYQAGQTGWSINRDGTADFADITVHSSDGSGNTVTIANGVITVRDTTGTVVMEIDGNGYRLYDSVGNIIAEIGTSLGQNGEPGFVAYELGSAFRRYYALISSGLIEFGQVNPQYSYLLNPSIDHSLTSNADPSTLALSSGYVGPMAYDDALLILSGMPGKTGNPKAQFTTGGRLACDVDVSGTFTAANRIVGTASITPVANTPTSLAITFPRTLQGTNFICQVTAQTSVPGTTVTGVGYNGLSATGVTLWLTRTNTTATTLSYTVEGY